MRWDKFFVMGDPPDYEPGEEKSVASTSGRRFVQRVDGYEATLVAGKPIFERGEHTGAMPGRLVRAGGNRRRLHAA